MSPVSATTVVYFFRDSSNVIVISYYSGVLRCRAIWLFAAATTFAGLKPNFFNSCLRGADAPKVLIPMLCPLLPVYFLQPKSDACSSHTLAFICEGRTDSR